MDPRIDLLLKLLDQAYDKSAWHGTNLRGSLRGLTLKEVLWRPGKNRHNIWEIAVHCAYWKFCVRRTITGDRTLKFPRKGSNWFPLPKPADESAWKKDLALLRSEHLLLRSAVAAFPASNLTKTRSDLKRRYEEYIYGAASHDLYHAGQIQLLKRLCRTA
jgi:hypothetical protein